MLNFDTDDLLPHFIYCYGDYYYYYDDELKELILSRMTKYGLESSILTTLCMERQNLITKEKSKAAYEGKLKNERDWKDYEGSINDDLESLFNHLQEISSLEEVKDEELYSFFLPKLTDEELALVEKKDREHMDTYGYRLYADVDPKEMKESDSKDKYLHGYCKRVTEVLNLDENLSKTSRESSSESSFTIPSETESLIETPAEEKKCCDCNVS